jgi:hypothetical protein
VAALGLLRRFRSPQWQVVLFAARWLAREAPRRWNRLSERERREVTRILRKSRGRRANVTDREFSELRRLIWKALGPEG